MKNQDLKEKPSAKKTDAKRGDASADENVNTTLQGESKAETPQVKGRRGRKLKVRSYSF